MRLRPAVWGAVVVVILVGQGCGGGDDNSDQEAITAVLNELRDVQESGDAARACSDVYVVQEAERGAESEAEGEAEHEADEAELEGEEAELEGEEAELEGEEGEAGDCEAAFEAAVERSAAEVKDLTTEIGSIEVDGDHATAIVHTELQRLDGSSLSQEVPYDLVRTPDGWRIRISEEG